MNRMLTVQLQYQRASMERHCRDGGTNQHIGFIYHIRATKSMRNKNKNFVISEKRGSQILNDKIVRSIYERNKD